MRREVAESERKISRRGSERTNEEEVAEMLTVLAKKGEEWF